MMQQLEIKFFWPLTEQIPLDLVYYEQKPRMDISYGDIYSDVTKIVKIGNITRVDCDTSLKNYVVLGDPADTNGYWLLHPTVRVHSEKPSWIREKIISWLMKWKWVNR